MSKFSYFARDSEGKRIQAIAESPSLNHLISTLREKNLTLISVSEIKERIKREKRSAGRIKLTDISFFFRQLATMLGAGVPLVDSLRELSTQSENLSFSRLITNIREEIEKGSTFSQSLIKYPRLFPPLITSMIEAGEEGGNLTSVLEQVSIYLEDRLAMQRQVRSATTYPLFIAGFFVVALSFIVFFLIPKFETIFSGFNVALPLLTRMVIDISRFLFKNLPYIFIVLLFLVFGSLKYNHTLSGRRFFDKIKIKIPLIGRIFHMTSLSYFCRTFSVLVTSGVSVVKSLGIVGRVSGNILIEEATEKIRLGVIGGSNISSEMRRFPIFPPLVARMIAVGESTGKLDEMFSRINKFYQEEVETRIKVLTSVLEPVMLLGLGVIVGIVVIALYLPIFQMAASARM